MLPGLIIDGGVRQLKEKVEARVQMLYSKKSEAMDPGYE